MATYEIRAFEKALPPGGLATHMVLGFFENGQLVHEYNGLSTLGGVPVPVGWPWETDDSIRVYRSNGTFVGGNDIINNILLYSSEDHSGWARKLDAADLAKDMINSKNMAYQLLSQNSNSAFETLIRSMDLTLDNSYLSGNLVPGRTNLLLESGSINIIKSFSAGGAISGVAQSAFQIMNQIGSELYTIGTHYGVYLSFDDIMNIRSPTDARNFWGRLQDKLPDPVALSVFGGVEEALGDLADLYSQNAGTMEAIIPELGNILTNVQNVIADIAGAAAFLSPLVIDLDGDGIETIASLVNERLFDFADDGVAVTAHGWLKGDDGFLVRDIDGNGLIDSGHELFGSRFVDGFTALARHDDDGNGIIDQNDAVFASLGIWQDRNEDGVTQAGEMQTLAALGITAIGLDAQILNGRDQGNWIALGGVAQGANGKVVDLADVYFKIIGTETSAPVVVDHDSLVVMGGQGEDILVGNTRDQIFRGGASRDVFVMGAESGHDVIIDFKTGEDRIDISGWQVASLSAIAIEQSAGDSLLSFDGSMIRVHGRVVADDLIW